jgi:hypothetical protein
MKNRIYQTDNEYLIDILEDEEERLIDKLGGILPIEIRCLFYRYIAVKDTIEKIKSKTT